jgi:hypothetical protein
MIKPALRRGWRDRRTLQYGVAPAHAVLLEPVDDPTAAFLDLLDGTRSVERLRDEADRVGLPPGAADRLLGRLRDAGVLDDAAAYRAAEGGFGERLRADLASLSAVHPEPGGGPGRLAARGSARVRVCGAGRVGSAVAALLSAAGVGRVDVVDAGCVEPWDTLPGGIPAGRTGERRDVAARRAVSEARPWPRRPPPAAVRDRDGTALVVFAPRDGLEAYAPDPSAAEDLLRTGAPHLYTGVVEGTGFVGPLVLPGVTPCAECLMRSRTEREPGWPLIVAQWRTGGRRRLGVGACDAALATAVAGITASYALSLLDGDGGPAAGFRTRLVLPHLLPETERFAPHDSCSCGAATATGGPPPSARVPAQATMAG